MIKTDIGEYIVGAYLKITKKCDFVDYNVRPPGGGLEGLNELDVVELDFKNEIAYLCEVTTQERSKKGQVLQYNKVSKGNSFQ